MRVHDSTESQSTKRLLLQVGVCASASPIIALWVMAGISSSAAGLAQDPAAEPQKPGTQRPITPGDAKPQAAKLSSEEKRKAASAAVDAWVASDQSEQERLERTVKLVLAAGHAGLEDLGERTRRAAAAFQAPGAEPSAQREVRGLESIITHAALQFMDGQIESGVVFAGQYAPLRLLEPMAGKLLETLVFATPDWYLDTQRNRVIYAMRDYWPKQPPTSVFKGMEALARDTTLESETMRQVAEGALHQWGQPALADARLARLVAEQQSEESEGREDNALYFLSQRADLCYQLRLYPQAARLAVSYVRAAERGAVELRPSDYYDAACFLALSDDPEAGLTEMEKAIDLQLSDESDASAAIEESLLRNDPEIASLRASPRFGRLMQRAFPDSSSPDSQTTKTPSSQPDRDRDV